MMSEKDLKTSNLKQDNNSEIKQDKTSEIKLDNNSEINTEFETIDTEFEYIIEDDSALIPISSNDIKINFTEGSFEIVGFDNLKYKIDKIGDFLRSIEVTQENIKDAKKLVARVRKAFNEIDTQRKEIYKVYLLPYKKYADQVKEIDTLTKKCEYFIREQINELEEIERDNKEKQIRTIFKKRLRPYTHSGLFDFERFLNPSYLNKSYSIKKIEQEMVNWMEQKESDINAIIDFCDKLSYDTAQAIDFYLDKDDLGKTLSYLDEKQKKTEKISGILKQPSRKEKKILCVDIRIKKDNFDKVQDMLNLLGVEYRILSQEYKNL